MRRYIIWTGVQPDRTQVCETLPTTYVMISSLVHPVSGWRTDKTEAINPRSYVTSRTLWKRMKKIRGNNSLTPDSHHSPTFMTVFVIFFSRANGLLPPKTPTPSGKKKSRWLRALRYFSLLLASLFWKIKSRRGRDMTSTILRHALTERERVLRNNKAVNILDKYSYSCKVSLLWISSAFEMAAWWSWNGCYRGEDKPVS